MRGQRIMTAQGSVKLVWEGQVVEPQKGPQFHTLEPMRISHSERRPVDGPAIVVFQL